MKLNGQIHIKTMQRFFQDETGATAIEYGLIAALVAVAAIGGIVAFGDAIRNSWGSVSDTVETSLNSTN